MNQIKSIQLGVIAICIATVPLSLAQTPRTRTSGSNQIITTTTAAPIRTGSNGNSTRAPQIGINPGNAAITGAIPNIGAHTATNPGVQTGISNHAVGITSAATAKSGSTGNSTMAVEAGTNAAAGTNTTAKAQTGTGTDVKTTQPEVIIESTQLPTLFTPTPSPTSTPSATPMASLAPAPSASVSPTPTPL
jgi:hypothetical protein